MKKLLNHPSEPFRLRAGLLGGTTLALATLLAMPVQAAPIGAILGSARDFTAFAASTTGRDFQFNKSIVRGAMGFGPRIKPMVGDGSQLLGDCFYDPGLPLNPCFTITSQTGNRISSELTPIVQDIKDAVAFVRALPPTRTIMGDLTPATKPPISSAGPGSVNVIKVTGRIKFSAPLTITGGPTDYFLFNVAGTFECYKAQVIQLRGGVPATNVLFVHGDRVVTASNCGWNGTAIATKVGTDNIAVIKWMEYINSIKILSFQSIFRYLHKFLCFHAGNNRSNVSSVTIPKGAILVPDGRLAIAAGADITGEPFTVYDYGDAPDSYGTTYSAQGARHAFRTQGPRLGNLVDAETDGQPTAGADGDDKSGYAPDDEDGIVPSSLTFKRGDSARFTVLVNNPGPAEAALACWLDLNGTKTFSNAPRRTASVAPGTVNGTKDLDFGIVPTSAPDITYLRCRISIGLPMTGGQPSPLGTAPDGEVEDYQVQMTTPLQQVDWGDAPDGIPGYPSYPTLKKNNGPSHILGSGLVLGKIADAEPDGQPDGAAIGDDSNGMNDEDGLDLATVSLPRRGTGTFKLNVTNPLSVPAYLACWIDFDGNGRFEEGEKVVDKTVPGSTISTLAATVHPIQALFTVPANAPSFTFLRCRVGTVKEEVSQPTGPARDGEVEDYQVQTDSPLIDHGDAPDPPYPTLDAHLGAAAVIMGGESGQGGGLMLGDHVDPEVQAHPNDTATGDDEDQVYGYNDEDGVIMPPGQTVIEFTAGQEATLTLKVTNPLDGVSARLNCWIDFNRDGMFGTSCPTPGGPCIPVDYDPERIVVTTVTGPFKGQLNPIGFMVPADSVPGNSYLRCRIGTVPEFAIPTVDQPWGVSNDGEVEDYLVHILP